MSTETSNKHKSLGDTNVTPNKIRKVADPTNLDGETEATKELKPEIANVSDVKAEEKVKELDKNNEEKGGNPNEPVKKKRLNSLSVILKGLKEQENIQDIFPGCNIGYSGYLRKKTNELTATAFVSFEDTESLLSALSKNGTDWKGSIIKVDPLKLIDGSKFTVFVRGLSPTANIDEIFHDCDVESHKRLKEGGSKAYVHLKNEDSVEKALAKNNTMVNNWIVTVKRTDSKPKIFTSNEVFVQGLSPNTNIDDLFDDCRIISTNILKHKDTNEFTGNAYVMFDNEESLQNALLKDETTQDGCVIRVSRPDCNVVVYGLNDGTVIQDVFEECNIHSYEFVKDELGVYQGTLYVNFKDIESVKHALMRDRTEFNRRAMLVGMFYKPESTLSTALFHKTTTVQPKKQSHHDHKRKYKRSFRGRR